MNNVSLDFNGFKAIWDFLPVSGVKALVFGQENSLIPADNRFTRRRPVQNLRTLVWSLWTQGSVSISLHTRDFANFRALFRKNRLTNHLKSPYKIRLFFWEFHFHFHYSQPRKTSFSSVGEAVGFMGSAGRNY